MVFDDGLIPQLLDAQEVALQLEDVLLVHRYDLHRVQFLRLLVLALIDSGVGSLADQLLQPVLLVEGVDVALLLLLVLVRVPPQQFLMEEAVCFL